MKQSMKIDDKNALEKQKKITLTFQHFYGSESGFWIADPDCDLKNDSSFVYRYFKNPDRYPGALNITIHNSCIGLHNKWKQQTK